MPLRTAATPSSCASSDPRLPRSTQVHRRQRRQQPRPPRPPPIPSAERAAVTMMLALSASTTAREGGEENVDITEAVCATRVLAWGSWTAPTTRTGSCARYLCMRFLFQSLDRSSSPLCQLSPRIQRRAWRRFSRHCGKNASSIRPRFCFVGFGREWQSIQYCCASSIHCTTRFHGLW